MSYLHLAQSFLRQCNHRSLQSHWFAYADELGTDPLSASPLALNDRGHIAWQKGRSLLCLGQDVVVPDTWNGYPLTGLTAKLALTWWAEEAIVFVNGQRMQEGDLFDCSTRILLTDRVRGGECFRVRLRLISPGHDAGALVQSRLEVEELRGSLLPEPSWLADELAIVHTYLQVHHPEEMSKLEQCCYPFLEQLDLPWDSLQFTLSALRESLIQQWGERIRQRRIHLLGHAHLDLAWLWPVTETWAVAERTFRSVLALQQDFPELIFAHSSPALYHWLEQHRPALFADICQAIQQRQWEPIAGLWVEPDTILPSGESLVRQVLYGQQYVQELLGQSLGQSPGQRNRVAWLPDSFGFSAQLPQILKQGGIDWFITQKLTWNDTTTFPHPLFQWQSTDGTIALALMSAPIGKGLEPLAMIQGAMQWEQSTGSQDYLWLVGVGDHGGGPSRDMLEIARRWQTSPCFPQLGFSRLHDYLQQLESSVDCTALPVWTQDLYLELHRGCYTSHSDQKQWNRHLEDLLYRAELWATWAKILADQPFPQQSLEQAWKLVLFNQFHDILPGSSIPEVLAQANQEWQQAKALAEEILSRSLQSINDRMKPGFNLTQDEPSHQAITIALFSSICQGIREPSERGAAIELKTQNSTQDLTQNSKLKTQNSKLKTQNSSQNSSHLISIPSPLLPSKDTFWLAWDIHGQALPTQSSGAQSLLVLLPTLPGIGYTQIHLQATSTPPEISPIAPVTLQTTATGYILENSELRVTIDNTTGQIQQLYSHKLQRNLLSTPGNQLQCFQDQGQYWDAWNIDPAYEKYPLTPPQLESSEVVEQGALRCSVRVRYHFHQSILEQTYCLDCHSPWLTIHSHIDWQEDHILLKVAFPLDFGRSPLSTLTCTTESACGAVERPVYATTPREAAQWEVPQHRWIDLSVLGSESGADRSPAEMNWGMSVINTGKYGADVKSSTLRLTLLRSPRWPDPQSDRGIHQFSYALYPHCGSWETAQTVTIAQVLNSSISLLPIAPMGNKTLPAATTLLSLGESSLGESSLQLMSFHPHPSQKGYVLRCYESVGQTTQLQLTVFNPSNLNPSSETATNLKIQPLNGLEELQIGDDRSSPHLTVQPWQIRSWLVEF